MKSIRNFALTLVIGLAGILYTANTSQAAQDCCAVGASCCTGEVCCLAIGGR